MNKKNKLLVSAAGMLVLTAAAASASTFAWFTTTRNASISYSQANVSTESGNLKVSFVSSLLTSVTSGGTNTDLTISGTHYITDISGDGVSFYKPTFDSVSTEDVTYMKTIPTSGAGVADGYYIDFTVKIERDNTSGVGMKVYLDTTTAFVPDDAGSSEDVAAVAASRLAVVSASSTTKFIWAQEEDDSQAPNVHEDPTEAYHYGYVGANASGTYRNFSGYEFNGRTAAGDADNFWATSSALVHYGSHAAAVLGEAAGVKLPAVADLTTATSENVTFRIWLEGTDPECRNDATINAMAGSFSLDLKLYGVEWTD